MGLLLSELFLAGQCTCEECRMLCHLLILPQARRWVAQTIAAHQDQACAIHHSLRASILPALSEATVGRARLVVVDRVPQPPLEKWGIAGGLTGEAAGITLDQVIFVQRGREQDASLVLHELVHAVQWHVLGRDRFLALYGLLLTEHGYSDHPLEVMAYDLQARFDHGALAHDLTPVIERRTQELLASLRNRSLVHRILFQMLSPRSGPWCSRTHSGTMPP